MYNIIFDDKVIEFLEKLPKGISKRVFNKIISAKDNPFRYFGRLEGRPEFKLRVGDYRIIADINQEERKISILCVNHRRRIYKRME